MATTSTSFDLATLDLSAKAEQGAELTLLHPTNSDPLGPVIMLAGSDSSVFRRAQNTLAKKQTGRRPKMDPEEAINRTAEILAHCTLSWRGVGLDGEDLPCTFDNAKKLYLRFSWVREQVDLFLSDRANYLQD